ncbi:MAG: LON peptidase substrate-binding domain-containing protein [Mycobacteriaceae bacterium]|nr:LON peptidase substrate-binding domain-containing protein [Mycobacteriaceae bacterium]
MNPTVMPMFPLETVLLPDDDLPLRIFEPRYWKLVTDVLSADDPVFGVVLIAAGREVGGGDERYDIGVLARIVEHNAYGGGRYTLRCRIGDRIRIREWLPDDPYPRAIIERYPDEPGDPDQPENPVTDGDIAELEDRVMALFERIAAARGAELPPRDMVFAGVQLADCAGRKLYALASRLPMGPADRYAVLAAPSAAARLRALTEAVDTVSAMIDFQLSGD